MSKLDWNPPNGHRHEHRVSVFVRNGSVIASPKQRLRWKKRLAAYARRRRTAPARTSKPIPASIQVPGSGTGSSVRTSLV